MRKSLRRHGLELIWGDYFFCYDGHGDEQSSYRAVVVTRNFHFNQIGDRNWFIRTPAQQIVWEPISGEYDEFQLSGIVRTWLRDNVGERCPDWYARKKKTGADLCLDGVMFRLKRDALAFIAMIDQALSGWRHERKSDYE